MGIFLRLGDSGLFQAVGRQEFPEGIIDIHLMERHQLILNGIVIVGKAHISKVHPASPLKPGKFIVAESSGDLSCAVRTEIKEHHGIPVFDAGRLSIL